MRRSGGLCAGRCHVALASSLQPRSNLEDLLLGGVFKEQQSVKVS